MSTFTGSDGFRIELDRRYYAEFRRQVRAASDNLRDFNAEMRTGMREALTPLAEAWRQNLPGSLKGTVKVLPTTMVVRAGNRPVHGDQPFLPWAEFGGRIVWRRDPAYGDFKRVPLPFGFRMRKVMGIKRSRVPLGRYMYPAMLTAKSETERGVADVIQHMLNEVFHAP